ncbi:MAG TPA: hypothetical protein VHP11_15705 [Tepidisphaeraceae bacterium]|nr:hypothetical protein [Tepidisphaeraceae bacterium]
MLAKVARSRAERWSQSLVLAGLLGGALGTPNWARAEYGLLFDLRVHDGGGKSATVGTIGDVVVMDLYAVLTGATTGIQDVKLQSGAGSFCSSDGGLLGDLLGLRPPSPFNSMASSAGIQNDLDGDGDKDVGPIDPNSVQGAFALYSFRAGSPATDMPEGGFQVGQLSFTATSLDGGATLINYLPRPNHETAALFWLDGSIYGGQSSLIHVGAPVTISFAGSTIPPGQTQYLSGTINEHLSVQGTIKPAAGSTLVIARGLDVASGASFEMRDEQGQYGAHAVYIEDQVSGNAGGSMSVGTMAIGRTGTGAFTQSAGFTRVGNLDLGGSAAASGTLQVTGGSLIADRVSVGNGGTGRVVQSGGHATFNYFDMGLSAGSSATVEIDGAAQFAVATETRIGVVGDATFRQKGGSTNLSGKVYVGYASNAGSQPASRGTLEITGGSFAVQRLNIGYNSAGTVVQSGGDAAFELVNVYSPYRNTDGTPAASYTLNGGRASVGGLFLGESVNGSNGVFVQNGGTLNVNSGLYVTTTAGNTARFELRGGQFSTVAEMIGNNNVPSSSELIQTNGSHTAEWVTIGRFAKVQYSGGSYAITRHLDLKGELDFANAPVTLTIGDRAFIDFSRGTLSNSAQASIVAGTDSLMNFPANYDPYAAFASIQTGGLIHINGQALHIPAAKSIHGSGTIDGDVFNDGMLSPGHSPGTLQIAGQYAQTPSGTLMVEIAGTSADQFDILNVTGAATLDGQLNVAILGEFTPSPSDQFVILTGDALSGQFDNALQTVSFDRGAFDIVYSPTSVTLTNFRPVPEPASVLLLAPVLLLRRHRRMMLH